MMYRVDLTGRAVRDLQRLYATIEAEHSATAQAWFNALEQAILGLDTSPNRHPVTPESIGLRHMLFRSRSYVYRVIFRIDEDKRLVTVLHIRHGARSAL